MSKDERLRNDVISWVNTHTEENLMQTKSLMPFSELFMKDFFDGWMDSEALLTGFLLMAPIVLFDRVSLQNVFLSIYLNPVDP